MTEVTISGEVHAGYSNLLRDWSGWPDATLLFGEPEAGKSPYARTYMDSRSIMANADRLVLNPNRVIITFTPFRVRQEAILTGVLMHEAGHARHSHWQPVPETHADGVAVAPQTVAFAKVCEEARVEARMATVESAAYLAWSMRASAAYLLPPTDLTDTTDAEQIMATLTSWCLRAGRQIALRAALPDYVLPTWVGDFNSLVHELLVDYFEAAIASGDRLDLVDPANTLARRVEGLIRSMFYPLDSVVDPDSSTYMIDQSRKVLEILFADPAQSPAPADPHGGEDEDDEGDDEGEDSPSEDEGDDESDDEGEGEGESTSEADSPGEGSAEGQGDQPGDGASASTEAAQTILSSMETQADNAAAFEGREEQANTAPPESGPGQGYSNFPSPAANSTWRLPTPEERKVAHEAGKFLRQLIEPSDSARVIRTETPTSTIDAGEHAAWKAGGQVRDPMFFRRTKRQVLPAPPVRIAVAVDRSISMDVMVKPSALLSWALTSAAVDLRNYAGRGAQVEACLVHWGTTVDVIATPKTPMPLMLDHECDQGTSVHGEAMDAIEDILPGFFAPSETPVNRLLVNFTDWIFAPNPTSEKRMTQALRNGVNCLSVVPRQYMPGRSKLTGYLERATIQRGRHSLVAYNDMFGDGPQQVWAEAARLLQ